MSNAHASDVEDILDTLRLLDEAHERQVAKNGGIALKTKESAKLCVLADWLAGRGWVGHLPEPAEREPELPEEC